MSETLLEEKTKVKGLSGTSIKFIAIIAMLIDHIAWAFVPTYSVFGQIMHVIGRITASIMCFFIAEGYYYTKNVKKYVLRLAIFALISHVPFIFFQTGNISIWGNTGVIYTLCLSLIALIAYDKIENRVLKHLSIAVISVMAFVGDWMCFPIFMTINFWKHRGNFKKLAIGHCLITFIFVGYMCSLYYTMGYPISYAFIYTFFQFGMILALPILYLYNGKKGKFAEKHKSLNKWIFYIFYPLHLVILGLLKVIL